MTVFYCSKCWRRPCECAGSRLLLQPNIERPAPDDRQEARETGRAEGRGADIALTTRIPTVERKVGNVIVRAPDYSQPGVAERVESEMRAYEASQLNGTLTELIAFNLRWRK